MFFKNVELMDDKIKLEISKLNEEEPKIKWSASYEFKIQLLDGTNVGNCDLRINHYDSLYYAGNIGYDVDLKYRGNGYAPRAVNLLVKLAKMHKMEYLIITCDPSNRFSKRVIEKANFTFVERCYIPSYHQMYKEGLREVLVYEMKL